MTARLAMWISLACVLTGCATPGDRRPDPELSPQATAEPETAGPGPDPALDGDYGGLVDISIAGVETRDDGVVRSLESTEIPHAGGEYAFYVNVTEPAFVTIHTGVVVEPGATPTKGLLQVVYPNRRSGAVIAGQRARIPSDGSWIRPRHDLIMVLLCATRRALPLTTDSSEPELRKFLRAVMNNSDNAKHVLMVVFGGFKR